MELHLEISGRVPKKVRKFVHRHYERWIQTQARTLINAFRRARVTIERMGQGHFFCCTIRLETAAGMVLGQEAGPNLHWAFDGCLRQLERQITAWNESVAALSGPLASAPAPA